MISEIIMTLLTTIFCFIGGLGVLVYGLRLFSEAMQVMTDPWLRKIYNSMNRSLVKATVVGAITSFFIQSGTSSSFMALSFSSSGLFSLNQLTGFLLGSHLGTLPAIGLFFFDFFLCGLPLLCFGVFALTHTRNKLWLFTTKFLFSVGVILLGYYLFNLGFQQEIMGQDVVTVIRIFSRWWIDPIWLSSGFLFLYALLASLFTCSRVALIALSMSFVSSGFLTLQSAFILVLGINIGSIISFAFYARKISQSTKRASFVHSSVALCWVSLSYFLLTNYPQMFINSMSILSSDSMLLVASFHIFYNIGFVLISLLLSGPILYLSKKVVPDAAVKESQMLKFPAKLRFLSPSLAIEQTHQEVKKMSAMVASLMELTLSKKILEADAQRIMKYESITDNVENELSDFTKSIFEISLTHNQVDEVMGLLRISEELESLADHCKGILLVRNKLDQGKAAHPELLELYSKVQLQFERVFGLFTKTPLGNSEPVDLLGEFEVARFVVNSFDEEDKKLGLGILKHLDEIERSNYRIWHQLHKLEPFVKS